MPSERGIVAMSSAFLSLYSRSTKYVGAVPILALALLFLAIAVHPAPAIEPLSRPTGGVILTVTGDIGRTNAEGRAEFDRTMLKAIGTTELTTSTSWTDGRSVFEGVLARDVLRAVGAQGDTVTATALNDYSIEIPVSDFQKYRVLFALSMDGAELTVRDKGPIWIVYPRDDHPELRNQNVDSKWIWQLAKIDID